MTDLRSSVERLSQRGQARGASAVLDGAMSEALERRAVASGATPITPLRAAPRVRRGRRTLAASLAFVGMTSTVALATFALNAVQGDGGYDSPEEATRALIAAVDHEDVFGALATFDPVDVPELEAQLHRTSSKAKQLDIVRDAADPFAAFDVTVGKYTLSSATVAPGVARVTIRQIAVLQHGVLDQLGPVFSDVDRDTFAKGGATEYTDLSVMAVERDGAWYLSPTRTAIDTAQVGGDENPPPDYSKKAPAGVELGGATPQAAAERITDAYLSGDAVAFAATLDPVTVPAWEYLPMWQHILDTWTQGHTADGGAKATTLAVDDDHALVNVTAPYSRTGSGWSSAGYSLNNFCPELVTLKGADGWYAGTAHDSAICGLKLNRGYVNAPALKTPPPLSFVQRDGRWFLSPSASIVGVIQAATDAYTTSDLSAIRSSSRGWDFSSELKEIDRILSEQPNGGVAVPEVPYVTAARGEDLSTDVNYYIGNFAPVDVYPRFLLKTSLEVDAPYLIEVSTSDGTDVSRGALGPDAVTYLVGPSLPTDGPFLQTPSNFGCPWVMHSYLNSPVPPAVLDVLINIPDLGDGPLTVVVKPLDSVPTDCNQ